MTEQPKLLFVSWQDEETRRIVPVARLLSVNGSYEFAYIKAAEDAVALGFEPLVSFPRLDAVYRSARLPPLFENRVMPRSREDYRSHIASLALDLDDAEPFTVLARTGGKRVTDRLEVFSPPIVSNGTAEGVFLARGIRHVLGAEAAVAALHPDDRLFVMADVQNTANRLALALRSAGCAVVGYVPDYLAMELGRVGAPPDHLHVFAMRINPDPAPVHHRLLCRFEYPVGLGGAELFRDERYEPISPQATRQAA